MNNLEKKVDALITLCLCEDEAEKSGVRKTLRELLKKPTEPTAPAITDYKSKIVDALLEIGVPDHILGHDYLMYAIEVAIHDKGKTNSMTKELYPEIAGKFNTTASRVERAIRHAVEVAWDRVDINTVAKYFGGTISPSKGKPTNTEFIARMANVLR